MDNNTQEVIRAGGEILKSVTAAIDKNDYSRLASDNKHDKVSQF